MQKLKLYLDEAYTELVKKVTWPTWSELQNSALIVMIATAIIAVVIYLMDITFSTVMHQLYKLLS